MDTLFLLALLACPLGMGAMMWFMMRGKGHTEKEDPAKAQQPRDTEIAQLQAEVDQLRAATRDSSGPRREEERD